MATYSARAYNAYGWPVGWLRLASADAGKVVNGVGEAEVVAVGPFAVWWRDIGYIDVWRYSGLGRVGRWRCYMVRGWEERYDTGATTYAFRGMDMAQVLAGRPGSSSTDLDSDTIANVVRGVITSAGIGGAFPLTVVNSSLDGLGDTIDFKMSNQSALAALRNLANASRALSVTPLNFDVYPAIQASGALGMGIATWSGEYGADRRVSSGHAPLALWLKAITDKYTASRDESGIITIVNLTGGNTAPTVSSAALDNPYGNYWAATDSSTGAQATANAYRTLWTNRPVTRLSFDVALDVDRIPLGLGDVVSVAYGGAYVDGRVNVMHAAWNSEGEKITARVDIEI